MITIMALKKHVQKHKTQPLSKKQKHHDIYATQLIFFGASWPCHCLIASLPQNFKLFASPVRLCLELLLQLYNLNGRSVEAGETPST